MFYDAHGKHDAYRPTLHGKIISMAVISETQVVLVTDTGKLWNWIAFCNLPHVATLSADAFIASTEIYWLLKPYHKWPQFHFHVLLSFHYIKIVFYAAIVGFRPVMVFLFKSIGMRAYFDHTGHSVNVKCRSFPSQLTKSNYSVHAAHYSNVRLTSSKICLWFTFMHLAFGKFYYRA